MDSPEKTPLQRTAHSSAVPQRGGAATGGNARSAGAADRPRRALLLPPRLSGPDRTARRRRSWKRGSCKASAARSRTSTSAAPSGGAACWACWSAAAAATSAPSGSTSPSCASGSLRPAGDGFRQAEAERAGVGDAPSPRGNPGRRRRGAGGPDPARLSADRRPAAVADAADRPRGPGGVRGAVGGGLSGGISGGPRPLAAAPGPAGDPFSRQTRRVWPRRGGGWSTRSCSFCSWPWR